MGWSCSAKASFTLQAISDEFFESTGISNGLPGGGFYETGREQADGAIVGSVWKPIAGSNMVRRAGGFKIDADGKIVRFPGLSKAQRHELFLKGAAKNCLTEYRLQQAGANV